MSIQLHQTLNDFLQHNIDVLIWIGKDHHICIVTYFESLYLLKPSQFSLYIVTCFVMINFYFVVEINSRTILRMLTHICYKIGLD